ncbi:MAG: hypothetical protein ACI8T1_005318, partial [Verrucomicrobiales bacterium]
MPNLLKNKALSAIRAFQGGGYKATFRRLRIC